MGRRIGSLVLVGLVVAVSGCATVDPWQDARIESEVKARLVAEKDANLTRLGVVSRQSVVYLTGDVVSAEQKVRAESVASTVRGVRRVVNALEVRAPRAGPSTGSP
jgi:osmotically-inducible protein OsmY